MEKTKIDPKGIFTLTVWKNGVAVESFQENNLVVSGGRNNLAALLGGSLGGEAVTRIGFGDSGAAAALTDTALVNPIYKDLDSATIVGTGRLELGWTLDTTEGNGKTIREFGLFRSGGALFARKAREPIAKTSDIRLTGTWTIIF